MKNKITITCQFAAGSKLWLYGTCANMKIPNKFKNKIHQDTLPGLKM